MPHRITVEHPPIGYVISSARRGEKVPVAIRGFISTEDGNLLVTLLDNLSEVFLNRLPESSGFKPSSVDHVLIAVSHDGNCTIYINEIPLIIKAKAKRPVKKGEPVRQDDIFDITELDPSGVKVEKSDGVVFLFSAGWRKGLYFDFSPIAQPGTERDYDLKSVLGNCYSYLMWNDLYKISDTDWTKLIDENWYPFLSLSARTIKTMIDRVKNGWPVDDLLPPVIEEVTGILPVLQRRWPEHPLLHEHLPFLKTAVERFKAADYISANSILYTRIEGIMRSVHHMTKPGKKPNQTSMVKNLLAVRENERPTWSLLFPKRFHQYIEDVYFKSFKIDQGVPLSRHSVAHGVAGQDTFTAKAAVIGLLMIDQIFFFLPKPESKQPETPS